jgi:hypothetical protein
MLNVPPDCYDTQATKCRDQGHNVKVFWKSTHFAERHAQPTPPAGLTVETGLRLLLREIIETKGLVGVGLAHLVRW